MGRTFLIFSFQSSPLFLLARGDAGEGCQQLVISTSRCFNVFIVNHCPLMLFSGDRGTNITPDRISGKTVNKLLEICDEHLLQVVEIMDIKSVVGVGKYAEKRALKALKHLDVEITSCWHPSPASPLANRNKGNDWKENIKNVLPKNKDS